MIRFLPAVEMTAQAFQHFFKVDSDLKKPENLPRHSCEGGKRKFDEVNLHSRYRAKTNNMKTKPVGFEEIPAFAGMTCGRVVFSARLMTAKVSIKLHNPHSDQ